MDIFACFYNAPYTHDFTLLCVFIAITAHLLCILSVFHEASLGYLCRFKVEVDPRYEKYS